MPHRPWSFSSLTLYEGCPQRYKLKYIDKHPEPQAEAAARGNRVHEGIERYLRHEAELPEEAKKLETSYDFLKNYKLTIEQDWGFDVNWNPLPSWDHPDISCKMKLDVFFRDGNVGEVIDHKTGKHNALKHASQGQLYAIGASHLFPELEIFRVGFWYVDQGDIKQATYTKSAIDKFQTSYERRLNKFWNDETFKPISNKFNCKWCAMAPVCDYRSEE